MDYANVICALDPCRTHPRMIRTMSTRCGNICAAFTTNLHHVISHDAMELARWQPQDELEVDMDEPGRMERDPVCGMMVGEWEHQVRSEEHTSELQSQSNLV